MPNESPPEPTRSNADALVSVVMATYKGDSLAFLKEAVDSILAQTHRHIEFLIVLDGEVNTDTQAYLDGTAADDPRVRLIPLPQNLGPAGARNTGIAAAQGEYIAITDADDVAAPQRIERQLAFLKETGAAVAGSFYHIIDEDGAIVGAKQLPTTPRDIVRWAFLFNPIANPTVLARADVLKQNPYPAHHRPGTIDLHFEDYDLWVTLLRKGIVLRNQPEYLVKFRRRKGFLAKRRGLSPFYTDLKNKLHALPLYPVPIRPFAFLGAVCTSSLRLLPARCMTLVYRLRDTLRFHDTPGTPPDPSLDAEEIQRTKRLVWSLTAVAAFGLVCFVALCIRYGECVLDHLANQEPETVYRRGKQLQNGGEYDEAIAHYRRALALGLDWPPSRNACRQSLSSLLKDRGRIRGHLTDWNNNLLKNGEFRHGTDDWSDASWLTTDDADFITGGQSLRIDLASASEPVVQQAVALVPGVRYRFSYWLRTQDAGPDGVRVVVEGQAESEQARPMAEQTVSGTQDWRQFSAEFAAPDDVQQVAVALHSPADASGTAWLDQCVLAPADASLLRNGSFERGDAGRIDWLGDPEGVRLAADEATVREGRQSLRVKLPPTVNLGLWQPVDVIPGARYRLMGWIRTENAGGQGARLEVQDADGGWRAFFAASDSVQGTHDWTPLAIEFDVSPDTCSLSVLLRRPAGEPTAEGEGAVWFDAYALRKVEARN